MPPTVDPKAPAGGPPPANYPPPRPKPSAADQATLATDPLVVYADEVGSTLSNGRNRPVVEVVSYNLRTGRIAGSFRVGAVGEFAYPSQVMLAGRMVVMNLEKRLVVANLDGSGMRTLFAAPAGAVLTTFAISPDGKTVALGTEAESLLPASPLSFVEFVDIRTGAVLRRVEQTAFASVGVNGAPGVMRWLGNGSGVVARGIFHRDGGGNPPHAIAALDGSVRRLLPTDEQVSAGERYKVSFENGDLRAACTGPGALPRTLVVTEASSGRVIVASVAPGGLVIDAARWSPDGSSFLFRTWALSPSSNLPGGECFDWTPGAPWQLWTPDGVREVSDLRALWQEWDGPRFVEIVCNGPPPLDQSPTGYWMQCERTRETPATLIIGGKSLGQIYQPMVVGFID